MKKLEKLAKEHVEKQTRFDANELIKIYCQCDYEAGFRKARETVVELLRGKTQHAGLFIPTDIPHEISKIGEEEVE